jgi:hypothetical protein
MVSYGGPSRPALRTDLNDFYDLNGIKICPPEDWRIATLDEANTMFSSFSSDMTAAVQSAEPIDTLERLTRMIEAGLEKWPDAQVAVCPLNGEHYETLALGYVMGGNVSDVDLIQEFAKLVGGLKTARGAKYISWRKPFEWTERDYAPEDLIHHQGTPSSDVAMINGRRRILRCRVLITANAADPDWTKNEDRMNKVWDAHDARKQ